MFQLIAQEIENMIFTYKGKVKKVLILDLDNTLWGGVIGEDGPNVKLSNEGEGKIYQDFHKNVKRLKDFGVLLAINSKNNYTDAIEGLENPNSKLNKEDFVIIKANWNDKVSNIKEIASELNLGLDSFVFIDDNAVERSLVKEYIPEIEVPDFPEDMNNYNSWFIKDVVYKFFPKFKLTKEDTAKIEQYKANIKRKKLETSSLDLGAFLESLNININFHIDDERFIERYAQMTQKTNQFNLTTKRYTINDIKNFISSDKFIVYAIDYEDKFLKEGIIGLAIVSLEETQAVLDTFLLSCRVLKRGVEKALFDRVSMDLKEKGFKELIGLYYPTKKNIIVKDLFENYGFNKIDENKFIKEV
jgi:FkbH-like protein